MNRGKIITTRAIPPEHVARIKDLLKHSPKELAYFTLSVNSAFRAGDLIKMKLDDLFSLEDGRIEIHVRERKTKKLRRVIVNKGTGDVLRRWLTVHPGKTDYLFEGPKGEYKGTGVWATKVKEWCKAVEAPDGNYATHSLRKTFARTQHEKFGVKLSTLMHSLNHSSERETLTYLGILGEDLERVYQNEI